jgi:hypothetical protein
MAIDMISGWIPYSKDLKRFIAFWSSQSTEFQDSEGVHLGPRWLSGQRRCSISALP